MDQRTQIEELKGRAHIIEGVLRVIDDLPEFNALVLSSDNRRAAIADLMSGWGMSDIQASHAVDMPMSRLTKHAREGLIYELSQLRAELQGET